MLIYKNAKCKRRLIQMFKANCSHEVQSSYDLLLQQQQLFLQWQREVEESRTISNQHQVSSFLILIAI